MENVITELVNDYYLKINDEDLIKSIKLPELVRSIVLLAKNKDEINAALQNNSANNEFIEFLKARINDEVDANPALFDEFSGLLSRLANDPSINIKLKIDEA